MSSLWLFSTPIKMELPDTLGISTYWYLSLSSSMNSHLLFLDVQCGFVSHCRRNKPSTTSTQLSEPSSTGSHYTLLLKPLGRTIYAPEVPHSHWSDSTRRTWNEWTVSMPNEAIISNIARNHDLCKSPCPGCACTLRDRPHHCAANGNSHFLSNSSNLEWNWNSISMNSTYSSNSTLLLLSLVARHVLAPHWIENKPQLKVLLICRLTCCLNLLRLLPLTPLGLLLLRLEPMISTASTNIFQARYERSETAQIRPCQLRTGCKTKFARY